MHICLVELYSNGLNDIIIYDDPSVVQPWFASLYWSTEDNQWYSNPNAMAIYMGINGHSYVNINEDEMLNNFDIYPTTSHLSYLIMNY